MCFWQLLSKSPHTLQTSLSRVENNCSSTVDKVSEFNTYCNKFFCTLWGKSHAALNRAMLAINLTDLIHTTEAATFTSTWMDLRVENYFWHLSWKTGHSSREGRAPVTVQAPHAEVQWVELRTSDHRSERHLFILNSKYFCCGKWNEWSLHW